MDLTPFGIKLFIIRPVTRIFGGFENPSERISVEHCEGAKRPSGGGGGEGLGGKCLHLEPEKDSF